MIERHTNDRILRWLFPTLACVPIGVAAAVIACRIDYPFALEWMEGGVIEHVRRLLAHRPLYTEPKLEWTPFIYTPGYYFAGVPACIVGGCQLVMLRGLSTLAWLGSLLLVASIVKRETGEGWSAWAAAGLLAASYEASGGFADVARADSLCLFLILAAAALLQRELAAPIEPMNKPAYTAFHLAGAGALLLLAVLTKQIALAPAVVLLGFVIRSRIKQGLVLLAGWVGALSLTVGALQAQTNGWFWYYTIKLPAAHELHASATVDFLVFDLLARFPAPLALLAGLLVFERRAFLGSSAAWISAGLLLSSGLTRAHEGSYDNVLLPAHAGLAILFGVGLAAIARRLVEKGASALSLRLLVVGGFVIQIGMLTYDPRELIPGSADRAAGARVVEILAESGPRVLAPRHPELARHAGLSPTAHEMALSDVLRGDPAGWGARLKRRISDALQRTAYDAILVDYDWLRPDIERTYTRRRHLDLGTHFFPPTGMPTRPTTLYLK